MSAAAETATDAVPARKGRKKLVIAVALAVLLAGGGGAAAWVMKAKRDAAAQQEAEEAEGDDGDHAPARKGAAHADAGHRTPPTFLPLETFVVNLADKEGERFAQIGVTLEMEDAKAADELKAYMPAIRNGILMLIAHKTSQELATREGKELLQAEIARESVRPLGIELPEPGGDKPAGKRKGKAPQNPVKQVHFSSFIMQ